MINSKNFGLLAGPFVFFLINFFFQINGLDTLSKSVIASTAWIAIWWVFEAVPIAITALLPVILFPLTGSLSLDETSSAYGHRYIFLYLGGFILALAIEKWKLHKRIALNIISFLGSDVKRIILGFMISTAFLSMWISNTATAVMMLPIAIAIIKQISNLKSSKEDESVIFGKALMISIAFSASIGGVSTLIGTPPNLILASIIEESYGIKISFKEWMLFALPISCTLLIISWVYLTRFAFNFTHYNFDKVENEINSQLNNLGKISYEEKLVSIIFLITAISWVFKDFIQIIVPYIDDAIIAIISAITLFLLNSGYKTEKLMKWEDAIKLPWGILLLFGGGLAIASAFQSTGLANYIGESLNNFGSLPLVFLLLLTITMVNFLTEITSNLATTAMLLPIISSISWALDIHPFILMIGATVAASCAFMLPVATPPNAVVFGSNYLRISDMVKVGLIMNIISILLILIFVYYYLPNVWNFDPFNYPF
tara:strand:+ start:1770 stop:3224 length:1455 start_codon:yes stop_codon:yes gene_type:complete